MPPKVIVRDLKKRYGAVEAARGISFDVEAGEIFGLIGPNGAGKTTTVECVVGLREPDEGTIEVCGVDARRQPREAKQKIGAALQTTSLQDKITPREALALFGSFYRLRVPPGALLERFGLIEKADAPFDTLSGGQRQRLALALAFVNRPELVLLDEPTTGLDAQARRDLHGEIGRMKQDGHTVLLTTHDIDEAEALCDRLAVIDKGRIVAIGETREIVSRSSAEPAVLLIASAVLQPEMFAAVPGVRALACDGHTARFLTHSINESVAGTIAALNARAIEIVELHVQRANLEDVFLELTGSRLDGQSRAH
jgi:ABC-2 type transport system ATP-binding protein